MSDIIVRANPGDSRFELLDGATVIGEAEYRDDAGEQPLRIFFHTVVDKDYAGQGLAGRLAARALDDTVEAGRAIVPVCSFIHGYLGKHPEYAGHVVAPTPAIIESLSA